MADGTVEGVGAPLVDRERLEHLARLVEADRILDSLDVGDAVLRARYAADPAMELTVRHLVVLSERYEADARRREARAQAAAALERIQAGEDFAAVAGEVSQEPGAAERGGRLEPGREGTWVSEFWTAASALDAGEVSGVVETPYGFHVLELEARDTVPFQESRSSVILDAAAALGALDPEAPPPAPLPRGAELLPPPPRELEGDGGADTGDADAEAGGARAVAQWPDGTLTLEQLRRHLATLPRELRASTMADEAGLREALGRAVGLRAAADSAAARGLSPVSGVVEGLRREWEATAARWAGILGFRPGMAPDAVRDAALDALGRSGQEAELARREIRARSPLLRLHLPVRVGETSGGAGP